MRTLASIQKIINLAPIAGADRIEKATVLGWDVVIKKGNFNVGDLGAYFEIDSWIPSSIDPSLTSEGKQPREYEGIPGERLRTVKLRGQVSQGLLIPLKDLPQIKNAKEGDDVTDLLGIKKWESPEERSNNGGGNGSQGLGTTSSFPSFIFKTDQERVQNRINMLPHIMGESYEVSIKLDGSSMTIFSLNQESKYFKDELAKMKARRMKKMKWHQKLIYKVKDRLGLNKEDNPSIINGVCSRNIKLDMDQSSHFTDYVKCFGIFDKLNDLGYNFAVQGELISPSIQGNYEQVTGVQFYVYDIFDIDKQEYLKPEQTRYFVELMGLKTVPILEENINLSRFLKDAEVDGKVDYKKVVDNILTYAEGPGMNAGVKREGVVFKSNDSQVSFKAISNSYLLHKEKKQK